MSGGTGPWGEEHRGKVWPGGWQEVRSSGKGEGRYEWISRRPWRGRYLAAGGPRDSFELLMVLLGHLHVPGPVWTPVMLFSGTSPRSWARVGSYVGADWDIPRFLGLCGMVFSGTSPCSWTRVGSCDALLWDVPTFLGPHEFL